MPARGINMPSHLLHKPRQASTRRAQEFGRCGLLLLTLLLSPCIRASELPRTVTLATHDLYPYGSYQGNRFTGIAADRVRCALDRLGIQLQLEVMPWARAEAAMFRAQADGFFAASQSEARDQHGVRSVKIADQTWQWFLLADSPWAPDQPHFREQALVTSFVGANMQKYLAANDYRLAEPPVTSEGLAAMLVSGRIDAALANNQVMRAILDSRYPGVAIKSMVLLDKPLYVYFGHGFAQRHTTFVPAFNDAVAACTAAQPGNAAPPGR